MTNGNQPAQSSEAPNYHDGLTKREHFAAMAMQGFVANVALSTSSLEYKLAAACSVSLADALLKELAK